MNYDAQGDYHDAVTDSLGGTTDAEFDVNGDLIQIASPQGTIHYAYDPSTGLKTEEWTSNTDIHYSYDQAGELITVTATKLDGQSLAAPLVTNYSYDLDGNLVSTREANGVVERVGTTHSIDSHRSWTLVRAGPSPALLTLMISQVIH